MNKEKNRTRFAPSPTGVLHIGGARTALFNYLVAKKNNGSFVLRIEDTDEKRSFEKYSKEQYENLVWLGLVPDESIFTGGDFSPYQQKERLHLYKKYVDILLNKKRAYYCFCSKEDLDIDRKDYILNKKRLDYKYTRKCLLLSHNEVVEKLNSNQPYVIRFLVEENRIYNFKDEVRGDVSFSSESIEDFIICRWNGIPLLNFAVVIDDHLMQITHVLRAEEHLTNTSKQLALYEFFDWKHPVFAHLSIIVNCERKKISKRDKENKFQSVSYLREAGYLPEGILNYLMFLGWNTSSTKEFFSLKEMIEVFNLFDLNNRSPVFSLEKLNWFNNYWIRKMSDNDYQETSWSFIKNFYSLTEEQKDKSLKVSKIFREQINCFSDLPILSETFFKDTSKEIGIIDNQVKLLLEKFAYELLSLDLWNEYNVKKTIENNFSLFDRNKRKVFFSSLREMITGSHKGPQISVVINLIGKEDIKKRLKKTLNLY